MKNWPPILLLLLVISTLVVAAAGAYLKYEVLAPLGVYEDENIVLRFITADYGWDFSLGRGCVQLCLFNKTDKILY